MKAVFKRWWRLEAFLGASNEGNDNAWKEVYSCPSSSQSRAVYRVIASRDVCEIEKVFVFT